MADLSFEQDDDSEDADIFERLKKSLAKRQAEEALSKKTLMPLKEAKSFFRKRALIVRRRCTNS